MRLKMIKELIDEQTKLLNEETKHTHAKRSFWASDARKCLRKIYYSFKHSDEAEEFETRILRVFQNGNDVHERLAKYLEKAGVLEAEEVELPKNDYKISGRVDAMLKDGTLVEFKSINVRSMAKPIPEHVGQLQLYLFLMGDTLKGKRKGSLIYECKPNQKIFEFEMELDMDIINEILDGFDKVDVALKAECPPERDPSLNKRFYPCKYCNYSDVCFYGKKSEVEDGKE